MAGRRYVYILEEHIPYEGEVFHGCFTTFLKAEARKNSLLLQWQTGFINFHNTLLIRKEVIE